ncbi:putative oxidoreductase [Aspergillus steynii IBT 23096]|uniref:Putative oxidoreductase n=1 Tax=Aspergillus steynii IBT 23096 TaxID=1392250 RepID=A0A2I2GKZ5_9EURO|nr:putative oxidoreductase [Aspergillus steynii IBT 23096]PLB53548.1 putative oxidoreductase [Aspergillus steynii IBT 23096]
MAPIRVGLIGLSGAPADKYEGTNWTSLGHLPYLTKTPDYEIVALLNSSAESARAAVQKYNLPSETRTYGDPADLANDPEVDLVVCSVRVDRHFQTVKPSLIAGKAVYVEWPLDRNAEVAREMTALAATQNAKTIVGLQSSLSPILRKVRDVVKSGAIGRVVSSWYLGSCGNDLDKESHNVRYFLDREVGGSLMSIHVGHGIESVTTVLGEFNSFNSSIAITRPTVDVVDMRPESNGKVFEKDVVNTVPDNILMYGTAGESNAPVQLTLHAGKEFPGTPRLDWRIQGEKGWIRVTSPFLFLNVGHPETKVEIYRNETGQTEEIVADQDEWDALPTMAQNIARLYEAYRKDEWYPTFEWALKRHEAIEGMWKRFDAAQSK